MTANALLRLDRLATLYVARPVGRRRKRPVVLMYHGIAAPDGPPVRPYYQTRTSPAVFARHLAQLAARGGRVVDLGDVIAGIEAGTPPPGAVSLTFDDGHADFVTEALPLLQRHGFPATVFLPTAFIGARTRVFKGRPYLTWSEVRALHREGVAFGSHGVDHVPLAGLPPARLVREVRESKAAIEDALGAPVEGFSCPYAFPEADRDFTARLRRPLEDAGYRYGVTTILGTVRPGADRYFLPRLPVNDADDPRLLRAKLDGSYDWLHGAQRAFKALQGRLP